LQKERRRKKKKKKEEEEIIKEEIKEEEEERTQKIYKLYTYTEENLSKRKCLKEIERRLSIF
jgi:hypothetical protein